MDQITPEICEERRHVIGENFTRERVRIDKLDDRHEELEDRLQQLEKLALQMGEMLKRDDERLDRHDASLKDQGQRIGNLERFSVDKMDERIKELESKGGKKWDKLGWLFISGGISAVVAAAMPAIISLMR